MFFNKEKPLPEGVTESTEICVRRGNLNFSRYAVTVVIVVVALC